jgi:hypothetical protein
MYEVNEKARKEAKKGNGAMDGFMKEGRYGACMFGLEKRRPQLYNTKHIVKIKLGQTQSHSA